MKYYFSKFIDFLIFSNIFIALGAVAQGLVTYHLLNIQPVHSILAFLFFATLTIYNFSILIQSPKNALESPSKRVRWIFSHYRLNISITLISIISLIPLFFLISFNSKILLVFLGIISFGYSLPLFTIDKKKFGLRNIPGLKLFLIALVWSISTVVLPILEINESHLAEISIEDLVLLALKRFIFIAAITVPFDIRDLYQDKIYNLKTIPTLFGERKAYRFCQFLLLSYIILLIVFNDGINTDFFALTATMILSGWIIFNSDWKKNEYYYFLYLDGILILQFLMLVLFKSILI
jgi:4-hydroxybenzoate polyprenyltransferase